MERNGACRWLLRIEKGIREPAAAGNSEKGQGLKTRCRKSESRLYPHLARVGRGGTLEKRLLRTSRGSPAISKRRRLYAWLPPKATPGPAALVALRAWRTRSRAVAGAGSTWTTAPWSEYYTFLACSMTFSMQSALPSIKVPSLGLHIRDGVGGTAGTASTKKREPGHFLRPGVSAHASILLQHGADSTSGISHLFHRVAIWRPDLHAHFTWTRFAVHPPCAGRLASHGKLPTETGACIPLCMATCAAP